MHYSVCKALGIETTDKWYTHTHTHTHTPRPVLCNQTVHTNTEVTANRPDIIIKNQKGKTCILIDVAIPADRNVVQKEEEEKLIYRSLCTEIQRMWKIIPVITEAARIVTNF